MRSLKAFAAALFITTPAFAQGVPVRGVVYDSLHSRPLAAAVVNIGSLMTISDSIGRFAFPEVQPGTHRITAQHDAIDQLGISAIGAQIRVTDGKDPVAVWLPSFRTMWRQVCGPKPPAVDTGFVFGTVRTARNATVTASWIDIASIGTKISQKQKTMEVSADSLGNFALCGVPTTTGLTLRAVADSLTSGSFDIPPMDQERVVRRDLTLAGQRFAKVLGRVMADSNRGPIAGAELIVRGFGIGTSTNEKGEYALDSLPLGSHRIYVRKIGYAEVDVAIELGDTTPQARDIVMSRITILDSMQVVGKRLARDEAMRVFEEHRHVGLGKFLTIEDLEKQRGLPITSIIRQWPGIYVPSSHNPAARNPLSSRGPRSINGGCRIALYLDGVKWPFALDDITPDQLAGLEYYASPATTPVEYANLGNHCGVILMHSRYKTGK